MSMDLNSVLSSILGGQTQQTQASALPSLTALLGGGDISSLLGSLTGQAGSQDPLAALFGGSLGGQNPLAALFGGATTSTTAYHAAGRQQDDPILALLLGGRSQQADPLLSLVPATEDDQIKKALLLAARSLSPEDPLTRQIQALLAILDNKKPAAKPVVDNTKVSLRTYDVNVIRKLGDSAILGGNGDGKMSQKELATATSIITILGKLGNSNPILASLAKAVKALARPEVFSAIASKDGDASSIGSADIVISAIGDADRQLDTINLTGLKPPAAPKDPLAELIELLTGKTPAAAAPVAKKDPLADLIALLTGKAA